MDQAEALRNIIKNQNLKPSDNARVITVMSGKGGVGKSSTSINLAIQFRRQGKRVIILDVDFGLANIEVMFGVIPKYNLSDIIFKGMELKEVIMEGPEGVSFISGGSGIAQMANLDNEQIKRLVSKMSELEELADVIIVDTGAGIAPSVLEFAAASPEAILVVTPEPTSIMDAYALIKALTMFPTFNKNETQIKVLCNRVDGVNKGNDLFDKLNVVVKRFLNIDLTLLGSVPQDDAVNKAVMKQKPVSIANPNAPSTRAYEGIVKKLNDNESGTEIKKSGLDRFFIKIFNRKK